MRKNPHVRICGGLGSATTLVYPTAISRPGPGAPHRATVGGACGLGGRDGVSRGPSPCLGRKARWTTTVNRPSAAIVAPEGIGGSK